MLEVGNMPDYTEDEAHFGLCALRLLSQRLYASSNTTTRVAADLPAT